MHHHQWVQGGPPAYASTTPTSRLLAPLHLDLDTTSTTATACCCVDMIYPGHIRVVEEELVITHTQLPSLNKINLQTFPHLITCLVFRVVHFIIYLFHIIDAIENSHISACLLSHNAYQLKGCLCPSDLSRSKLSKVMSTPKKQKV